MQRRILGVTGIRSDYDIMSSVFKAIANHPQLHLQLIVTGAHLSEAFGLTVNDIRSDGFEIVEEIDSLINGDRAAGRVKGLAVQLQGLVQSVARLRPDCLIALGDREEAMTTALVGAYLNVPMAHIAGGDRVVGNVDDQVRHAVTKLAHLHFVTNEESYARVIRLGEQPFRVYNAGNPGLDRLLEAPQLSAEELSERLQLPIRDGEPLVVVIQHPLSSEIDQAHWQMTQTLEAIKLAGLTTVLSYPNSDAGNQQMVRAIREYEHLDNLYTARNVPRLEFVNLLRRASCLVGNSSAGILEAPLLKLPVVNIGNRQHGRLHSSNVTFVSHDVTQIADAIRRAVFDSTYRAAVAQCTNPYGDGHSSARIADALAAVELNERLLIKDITY